MRAGVGSAPIRVLSLKPEQCVNLLGSHRREGLIDVWSTASLHANQLDCQGSGRVVKHLG